MFEGFESQFDPNDPNSKPDDVDKIAAALSAEDAMALSVQVLGFFSQMGDFVSPGWRNQIIGKMCVRMSMDANMQLAREVMHLGIMAAVIHARMIKETRDRMGETEHEDQAEELCDPLYVLQGLIDMMPEEPYFEDACEIVKEIVGYEKSLETLKAERGHTTAQELEDLFNLPSPEDNNDES